MVTGTKFSQIPLSSSNPVSTSTFVAFDSANPSTDVRYTLAEMQSIGLRLVDDSTTLYVRTVPLPCTFTIGSPLVVNTPTPHNLVVGNTVAFSIIRTWQTTIMSITSASPAVVTTSLAHGLAKGDPIAFINSGNGVLNTGITPNTIYYVANDGNYSATTFAFSDTQAHALAGTNQINTTSTGTGNQNFYRAGTFPTGLVEGRVYFVVSTTANTFEISTTSGGTPINVSGSQFGYFVWSTGNDSSIGAAQTATGAFMTIQVAANYLSEKTVGQGFPSIQLADGTYLESVGLGSLIGGINLAFVDGGGQAGIRGNSSNPENVVINGDNGGFCFGGAGAGEWELLYLTVQDFSGAGSGLVTSFGNNSHIVTFNLHWGANPAQSHVYLQSGSGDTAFGTLEVTGNNYIVGAAARFVEVAGPAYCSVSHGNGFLCINPLWDNTYYALLGGIISQHAVDWSWFNTGVYSGQKATVQSGAKLQDASPSQIPGTIIQYDAGWFYDFVNHTENTGFIDFTDNVLNNAVRVQSKASTGAWTMTLPTSGGVAGYTLSTDGTGVTSWIAPAAGNPGGLNHQIQYNNAGAFGGITNFTSSGTDANITSGGVLLYAGLQVLQAQPGLQNFYDGGSGNLTATGTNNTATGNSALANLTTGGSNSAIGSNCLLDLTTGSNNLCVGQGAGQSITVGGSNVCVGQFAGQNITTAAGNMCVGAQSGQALAGGSNNVSIGNTSLSAGSGTNNNNIAIGHANLVNPSGSINNIAIGTGAMNTSVAISGSENVGLGSATLNNLTSGTGNIAIGNSTLENITTGSFSIGIGYECGLSCTAGTNVLVGAVTAGNLTSGGANVIIGHNANPASLTTGANNTLIGANISNASTSLGSLNPTKLVALADGSGAVQFYVNGNQVSQNIGIGLSAGNLTTASGSGNTCIGSFCGTALTSGQLNACFGQATGNGLTTGSFNSLLGIDAGDALTTGNSNTLVGAYNSVGAVGAGASITTGSFNTIVGTYAGTAAMASQVILSDGQSNIAVQYDMPNKVHADMTTTVGSLPAAGTAGRRAFVTNSNQTMAANVGATVTSGGANVLPVYDDGVTWKIG